AQFYGIVVNVFSVAANGAPRLSQTAWAVAAAALAAGALVSRALGPRVSEQRIRRLILALALAGGISVLVEGLWGMH
ncbi:MAG TPA: hypothetical protein VGL21_12605, partial [Jatrophihabitantaceae bacterium]